MRQGQRRLTPDETESLVSRYQARETLSELAEAFGCHRNTVSAILQRAGVLLRGGKLDVAIVDELVRRYESGRSMARVGEQLGISIRSVLNYLQARGVQTRNSYGRER